MNSVDAKLVEALKVNSGQSLDGVISGAEFSGLIGPTPAGGGKREPHAALKNFSEDHSPYMWAIHLLAERVGLEFDTRGGDFYEGVNAYYKQHAPRPGTGVFATNEGIPAGGQLKALIDLPLTDTSLGYFNKMFIANMILTPSPVLYKTGLIGQYGNQHNREYNLREILAEGRANVRQVYPYESDFENYVVYSYALMDTLSPDDYRNYMAPFNAEQDLTIALRLLLMLASEIDCANKLLSVADYPASSVKTLAQADRLNARKAGDLTNNVRDIRASIITECGHEPNTLVMDTNVFDAASRHPDVLGTIFQTVSTDRTASEAEVAKVFKIDPSRFFVGRTAKTSTDDKDATLSRVWGKDIWYGYVAPTRALRQRTFGYRHFFNNAESYIITRQSASNPINRDVFCYSSWQHHIVENGKRCGGLIKNAID